jgi:hypothetical protein
MGGAGECNRENATGGHSRRSLAGGVQVQWESAAEVQEVQECNGGAGAGTDSHKYVTSMIHLILITMCTT